LNAKLDKLLNGRQGLSNQVLQDAIIAKLREDLKFSFLNIS